MFSHLIAELGILTFALTTESIIAFSALSLLLIGVKKGDLFTKSITISAIIFLALAVFNNIFHEPNLINPIEKFYLVNDFTIFIKTTLIIATLIALLLYLGHLNYNPRNARFEYPVIMLLALFGTCIMISAKDFLTLYMGIELQALAGYILVSLNRDNLKSAEAGIKYFVLGAMGSAILLYGMSLIYGFSGSIFFHDIAIFLNQQGENLGLMIGIILLLIALALKIAAAPFHLWAPDVYEGSPTSVTLFIATVPKFAVFIAIARIIYEAFLPFSFHLQQIITFLAISSLLVGSLGAIRQQNFKRLLAFASINHTGFMLLTLLCIDLASITALLSYLILYFLMSFAAFAFLMLIKQSHNSVDTADKKPLEDINTYAGLAKTNPLIAVGLSIILLSMAGIPPMAGFFAKFFIFKVILNQEFYVTAIIAALSSVIAIFYYLRIIKIMFFDQPVEIYNKKPTGLIVIMFSILVLSNLLFFLVPGALLNRLLLASVAFFMPGF